MIIRAYRIRAAIWPPIWTRWALRDPCPASRTDPKSYGFTEADMTVPILSTMCWRLQIARIAADPL